MYLKSLTFIYSHTFVLHVNILKIINSFISWMILKFIIYINLILNTNWNWPQLLKPIFHSLAYRGGKKKKKNLSALPSHSHLTNFH